jgi:hypothetical protein
VWGDDHRGLAVSQDLTDASLSITDRAYGVLRGDDVRVRIRALGGSITAQPIASADRDKAAIVTQNHALLPQCVLHIMCLSGCIVLLPELRSNQSAFRLACSVTVLFGYQ